MMQINWLIAMWLKIDFKYRSSRSQIFCKIGVLKKFAKFTEKQQYRSLFFQNCEHSLVVFSCELYKTRCWEHVHTTASVNHQHYWQRQWQQKKQRNYEMNSRTSRHFTYSIFYVFTNICTTLPNLLMKVFYKNS